MSIGRVIDSHMDNELGWIVSERRDALFRENEVVKRGVLCSEIGRLVGEMMIQRLGGKSDELQLHADDFERIGLDALRTMTDDVLAGKAEAVCRYVTEACVLYAVGRTRGIASSYSESRQPVLDYWPFGQEGGFCNPRKLKSVDV